jgi:acyl carrier protein
MKKTEITFKVKEILVESLNLQENASEIEDTQPLFGTNDSPGLFDDSLTVLEVTSAIMAEFDLEASVFNENSFFTVETLSETIYQEIQLSFSN